MKRLTWTATILVAALLWLPQWASAQVTKAPAADDKTATAEAAKAGDETTTAKSDQADLVDSDFSKKMDAWLKDVKEPVEWFKWGADLRLRDIWSDNLTTMNENTANHERHFERYRARWWGTLMPHKDVDINLRFVWEPRIQQKGPSPLNSRYYWDEVIFDRMNVTWRNIANLPLTMVLGRQDIILGNGWLVLDGTPLDGSRTIFFDAVRFTYVAKDINTTFDAMYIDNDDDADRLFKPFNQTEQAVIEQDERGFIFYVTNTSVEKTQISGYYIYKHDSARQPTGNTSDIHTIGGRVVGDVGENWKYYLEGAHQWGEQNGNNLSAFGFNSRLTYLCKDSINSQCRIGYEFLSGDDPDSSAIEGFDPLWGRWPQWSELYVYPVVLENPGRPGEISNFHRINLGYTCNPGKNTQLTADYHLLWSDENTVRGNPLFSQKGTFRGQLLAVWLNHKFNDHVSGHLGTEFFFPGNFYTRASNDVITFLRCQLEFTL